MLGNSDGGDPESGGSTSDLRLARRSNYSGSGKALSGTSWLHRTGTYRGSVHSDWLCRSLPGQFGIPTLMLRILEPFGSSSGTASSLPSRLALLFHASPFLSYTHLRESIPGPCGHLSSFPLPLLTCPSGTFSLEKFHQAPLPFLSPGIFTDSWSWEAGKALRDPVQLPPLTDEGYLGPRVTWLAQGHSASWQQS